MPTQHALAGLLVAVWLLSGVGATLAFLARIGFRYRLSRAARRGLGLLSLLCALAFIGLYLLGAGAGGFLD